MSVNFVVVIFSYIYKYEIGFILLKYDVIIVRSGYWSFFDLVSNFVLEYFLFLYFVSRWKSFFGIVELKIKFEVF